MDKLTFEQLPEAVAMLPEKVNRIEDLLISGKETKVPGKEILNAEEAIALMGISKSMLYKMTHTNEIPFYKPGGKILYFKRAELMDWMSQYRVKTRSEIEKEAIDYVIKRPLRF
jgi:excisionase family DNA binding protein